MATTVKDETVGETTDDTTVPADSGKKERTPTWHVILEQDATDSKTWIEQGRVAAFSQEAAIAKHLGADLPEGRTFVAPPERSWRPKTPTVETQQKLVFGG